MTARSQLEFSTNVAAALAALDSVAGGKGWCNVVPRVVEDVPDHKVNFGGLWVNKGVVEVSFVTAPPRHGQVQPSTLGVLHTRGRLGRDRIASLLDGADFALLQDHNQRGLLLGVPAATPSSEVLDVMMSFGSALCDYEMTGIWRMDLYLRQSG